MKSLFLCTCFATVVFVVGCENAPSASDQTAASDEHSHADAHGLPQSYAAAVAQIKQCRDEVKQAFDAGTPDDCDHALHVAADALDALGGLAGKSDLGEEDVESVKTVAQELFGQFAEIHHGFHGGGEGKSFEEVAAKIDEGIAVLDAKVALAGHDHDHADDAGDESQHDQ